MHEQQTEVVADGFRFTEGPRWHAGRLWFSDMHDARVCAMDTAGAVETIARVAAEPSGLGWLPDGRLLVVSMQDRRLLRQEADGTLVTHADLAELAPFHCNDMVVGADGRAWVGNFGFDLHAGADAASTTLVRVDPDGSAAIAAEDLLFPNGSVLTPDGSTLIVAETFAGRLTAFRITDDGALADRRSWAQLEDGHVPDGICLDADGAIWVASPTTNCALRVHEGGAVSARVDSDRGVFACMLGGDDGRTLYLCTAGDSHPDKTLVRSGRIERARVEVAGAGLP